jgi:hypothetical protein
MSNDVRVRLLALAEKCSWPRFPIPGRRTPHDAASWRAFVYRAKPEELAETLDRLHEAVDTGVVGSYEVSLFDEPSLFPASEAELLHGRPRSSG